MSRWIPGPFGLALSLSLLAAGSAWLWGDFSGKQPWAILELWRFWEQGFFKFLAFAMQMMLILVLGHVLALSPGAKPLIAALVAQGRTTARAALIVGFCSIGLALFNWGLGLVFGAILARAMGEAAAKQGLKAFNYPLVGTAGYMGMMLWHGGLSGSAPLAVAEAGHSLVAEMGQIPFERSIFSTFNLGATGFLWLSLPLILGLWGHYRPHHAAPLPYLSVERLADNAPIRGAEWLERSPWPARLLAAGMLFWAVYKVFIGPVWVEGKGFDRSLAFITPNYLIFVLFALALWGQGSLQRFMQAAEQAIVGSTGILLQFPLYGGIMGLMTESGLILKIAQGFSAWASPWLVPQLILIASGLINMFVPSGGGQWLVQGPLVASTCQTAGLAPEIGLMALAYGDQLTNMLQPFWALPLLGITGLNARDILPYSAAIMLWAWAVFATALYCVS